LGARSASKGFAPRALFFAYKSIPSCLPRGYTHIHSRTIDRTKPMIRSLLIFAIVALTIQTDDGTAAGAAKPAKGTKIGYKGKFASFNPDLNTVLVTKGSKSVTFAMDKNAKLIVDQGKVERKINDLPPDTNISLVLNTDKSTILEMYAEGPAVRCTLEAIDADKHTLRVKTTKGETTYPFIENVTVTRGKFPRKFEDLKTGADAYVKLAHDKSKVVSINLMK
jgi:hypothetical protein